MTPGCTCDQIEGDEQWHMLRVAECGYAIPSFSESPCQAPPRAAGAQLAC